MKKSIKKLQLNKKAVSNLSESVKGGLRQDPFDPKDPFDPTANTWCYICPDDPIDTW